MTTTSRAAAPARLARRTMTVLAAAAAATLVTFSLMTAPAGASAPGSAAAIPGALAAVSCPATNACWAVGSQVAQQPNSATLARWDGTAWTAVSLPFPKGAEATQLSSVSCPSVTFCWAVGSYEPTGGGTRPYVLRWNGTAWSRGTLPVRPHINAGPVSVSCASTADCWEAGVVSNGNSPLEHWNGTAWTMVAAPAVGMPLAPALSCVSVSDCWMLGPFKAHSVDAGHWNGSSWSLVPMPGSHILSGISCLGKACAAVGRNDSPGGGKGPIAERWNGSAWKITLTAGIGMKSADLTAVSCAVGGKCLAVGGKTMGANAGAFSELWTGAHWHLLTTPGGVALFGVSCITASDCWGVGGWPEDIRPTTAIIEHWNGTAWSVVS